MMVSQIGQFYGDMDGIKGFLSSRGIPVQKGINGLGWDRGNYQLSTVDSGM